MRKIVKKQKHATIFSCVNFSKIDYFRIRQRNMLRNVIFHNIVIL